jgi:iron complex transport system substrate-binding protein
MAPGGRTRTAAIEGVTGASARRRAPVAIALLALLLGAGPAAALTVTDMLGRTVSLPAPPRRIVSLVPSATELLFALGAEDRLVGVTDFCDHPAQARRKPSVGGMLSPSLEAIVALRPDLVLVTDEGNRQETFEQLQRLGLPFYGVHARRLAEVFEVTTRLAALGGRPAAARPLIAGLERRVQAVTAAVAPHRRPRVLYVLWSEPLIVPARAALVTELITLAGGDSITAGEPGDYPRLGLEAAVARAPEVIVLARHDAGAGPLARDRWERLATIPAVRSGRIHEVDGSVLHRYGPRVVDGLERLARVIHPEAFR